MRKQLVWAAAAAVGMAGLAGCDDATGVGGASRVDVVFAASSSGSASASPLSLGLGGLRTASIPLTGSNGTLELDTIHVIVEEFELDLAEDDGACDDDVVDRDDCEKFQAGPAFVDLALDAGATTAASATVPPGVYDELELEIEDLDDDEDEAGERQRIAELRSEILGQFPEWPRDASMRVAGSFTPAGGAARRFVAYFEAEIEIELEFDTPFVVTEDDVSRTITVELDPADWFVRRDGSVMDLSAFDFASTGRVVEFEFEMEDGFKGVEHDDNRGHGGDDD